MFRLTGHVAECSGWHSHLSEFRSVGTILNICTKRDYPLGAKPVHGMQKDF